MSRPDNVTLPHCSTCERRAWTHVEETETEHSTIIGIVT